MKRKEGVTNLIVFQESYRLAMEIFRISKKFPKEECYSLTDQIRRSSRSICANLAEAYAKRVFTKHFFSKLTDVDAEKNETIVWIDFAKDCGYIDADEHTVLIGGYEKVGSMLGKMLKDPGKFRPR